MISRDLQTELKRLFKLFPVISVTGPRQSGKTTLVKRVFKNLPYASLEDPENLHFSRTDPRGFLSNYEKGAVIDEAQRVPELFSYIQGMVDNDKNIKYILTGSQNFLLSQHISQSLAGRVGNLTLLPFSMSELKSAKLLSNSFESVAFKGFYPPIFDRKIPPGDFFSNYVQTYVERDVRQMIRINDLHSFSLLLKLCAGRVGNLLNLSELANDTGITVNTIKSWIGVLEASFILFKLQPHHKNFNKRLIKMPKLYFHDTGLLCYLLNIKSPAELKTHYARGAIFENLIISDLIKSNFNHGKKKEFYFWRDHKGREIDLIIDEAGNLAPIEIKSGRTKKGDYFKGLDYWNKLSENTAQNSTVIYAGSENQKRSNGHLISWKSIDGLSF